jgi:uncharacterized coiled-coil DUF342 family protein
MPTWTVDEIFGDEDARYAARYRLAWMSARWRAMNERGSHAMTASSFEIFIESMREQAQAATDINNALRAQLASVRASAAAHAERHRAIFEAHLRQVAELTAERDEARAEVVQLGKQVQQAQQAHDGLVNLLADGKTITAADLSHLFDALFPKWSETS